MATISAYYLNTWKTLYAEWQSYTIFWRDFNPRQSDIPDPPLDDKTSRTTSGETSFNLSWFQNGNEVCFWVIVLDFDGFEEWDIARLDMIFQKYDGGWQNAWWTYWWDIELVSDDCWTAYWNYVGIDSDEIWTGATRYRFLYQVECNGVYEEFPKEFTISNLSFDDSLHPAWYLWVDGANLNYIDGTNSSSWYKHIINQDTSYSASFVWASKAWYIWLPSSTSDDHIYYIDENWYKRRTAASQTRFESWDSYAWTSKAWYMWVSDHPRAEYWYAHLCYVNKGWYKRRICNWWVA